MITALAALLASLTIVDATTANNNNNIGASYVPGVGAYFQPYTVPMLASRSPRSPSSPPAGGGDAGGLGRAVGIGSQDSSQMSHVSFPDMGGGGEKCSFVQMKGQA